jgi:molybdopterin-guanine dinucleotide biosynthesis protein A
MSTELPSRVESPVATNKAKIFAYIDPDLKEAIEALAEVRNRSVSNLLETIARDEIEKAKISGELVVKRVQDEGLNQKAISIAK